MTGATTTTGATGERSTGDLVSSRDFLEPAVHQAVTALRLPAGAWVLDAGTGAGGAVAPLALAAGSAGRVRAVELDPATAALAAEHVARYSLAAAVQVEQADILDVLDTEAVEPGGGFDVVWAGDVIGPDTFADPAAAVAAMARGLRPNGVVALFSANHRAATFLPGRPRLEEAVRAAARHARGLPAPGSHHPEQRLAWLHAAGLEDVTLRVFPRVAHPVRHDPAARRYLERSVWPEMHESAERGGAATGMTPGEHAELVALTTPGSARYVVDDPGFFVVQPTLLATGRLRHGRR